MKIIYFIFLDNLKMIYKINKTIVKTTKIVHFVNPLVCELVLKRSEF